MWEIFGSKSVVCECCVIGEAVSDSLKDRIVLVLKFKRPTSPSVCGALEI